MNRLSVRRRYPGVLVFLPEPPKRYHREICISQPVVQESVPWKAGVAGRVPQRFPDFAVGASCPEHSAPFHAPDHVEKPTGDPPLTTGN